MSLFVGGVKGKPTGKPLGKKKASYSAQVPCTGKGKERGGLFTGNPCAPRLGVAGHEAGRSPGTSDPGVIATSHFRASGLRFPFHSMHPFFMNCPSMFPTLSINVPSISSFHFPTGPRKASKLLAHATKMVQTQTATEVHELGE